jgi:hypothetical protein
MQIKRQQDFYAGLLFAVAGSAFAWGALSYQVGASARMGPGFFPLLLGGLLALLGLVMMWRAARWRSDTAQPIGSWAWKPLAAIISANLLFGVALGGLPLLHLPALGLMAGIYLLTLVACLAGDRFNLKEALLLATALAALSYLAFVLVLKLQLPVWPVWGA